MSIKNHNADFAIIISGIISIFLSFYIFFYALLTTVSLPLFSGAASDSVEPITVFLVILGIFYLIFPIYMFVIKKKRGWKKWMEYTCLLMPLGPIVLWLLFVFLS